MTLEQEAMRMRELDVPGAPPERAASPARPPSAWRWVARVVLVGFLALLFGFSFVYAPTPTTVFMFVFFFIGLVYLAGKVHELSGAVRELRDRLGKEGEKE